MIKQIPYPFRYIFKNREKLLNFKNVFFKLTCYYLKRVFKLKIDYKSSCVLLLFSQREIELPIDSLCEMNDIYENEIFDKQWKISKDSIVLDIGAHVGIFTSKIAKDVSKIIAIEPNSQNFNLLVENINRNKLTNIVPLNFAVSDEVGEKNLYFNKSSLGHGFFSKGLFYEKVQTITLNNLIKVFKATFIKINAEGAEVNILNGGKTYFTSSNITFAISTHTPLLKRDVTKILKSHNFNVEEGKMNVIHAKKDLF